MLFYIDKLDSCHAPVTYWAGCENKKNDTNPIAVYDAFLNSTCLLT